MNALLVGAKCVAVYYSSSISLVASLVDSALDLLSTFIILGTSWAIGVPSDKGKYPAGKRRFEPLGVLIFSVVMIVSFAQVFIEALQRTVKVIKSGHGEPADLSNIGIATMLATIAVKSVLWFWCSRIPSSGVQALAQDAENDVWLNVISLSFPVSRTARRMCIDICSGSARRSARPSLTRSVVWRSPPTSSSSGSKPFWGTSRIVSEAGLGDTDRPSVRQSCIA